MDITVAIPFGALSPSALLLAGLRAACLLQQINVSDTRIHRLPRVSDADA